MQIITVSAVLFERDGRVLTVRKHGTDMFMLPGGKPEPGESAADCARREVFEELGIDLAAGDVEAFGVWDAAAANEPDAIVRASVFRALPHVASGARPQVQAEIAEARWIEPAVGIDDPREAPLNRELVFPAVLGRD